VGKDLVNYYFDKVLDQSMDLDPDLFTKVLANHPVIVTMLDTASENSASIRKMATEAIKTQPTLRQLFADKTKWGQSLVRMGAISGSVFPTAVAFPKEFSQTNPPIAWNEEDPFTEEGFKAWLAKLVAGTAEGWKQSEPLPASNDGPVKVVVHRNFDSIVMDPTKDVLVEFYAPWCGHCKSLEPIYKSIGEHFAADPNVVIAKMDATSNYLDPIYAIKGFPTIKFFPAGEKRNRDIMTYEGARTYDAIVDYVKANRNSK
jgi:protein disulfide isomerase family A protein 3